MLRGKIKHYSYSQGHGLISPADRRRRDAYFEEYAYEGPSSEIATGLGVEYSLIPGSSNPPVASIVRKSE